MNHFWTTIGLIGAAAWFWLGTKILMNGEMPADAYGPVAIGLFVAGLEMIFHVLERMMR